MDDDTPLAIWILAEGGFYDQATIDALDADFANQPQPTETMETDNVR